jgi:erythromycin esterase
MVWLSVLVGVVSVLGCGDGTSGSRAFVEWASDNAIEIDSLDLSAPTADLEAIDPLIGSARLVGLGESRHDTREQLALKGRLVRHLIEDLGFRTLILEESTAHAEALDRLVRSGEGEPQTVLIQLAGWYLWDTDEMLELIEWIRDFNQIQPADRQVGIYGSDITAPALGIEQVLEALDGLGIAAGLDAQALGLDLHEGDFWPTTWQRYGSLSDERRAEITGSYQRLVDAVGSNRDTIVGALSEDAYERLLLLAEIGQSGNAMFLTTDRKEGGTIREAGMSHTTLWILDHRADDHRAILWAHNLHVATGPFQMPGLAEGDLFPMGVQLEFALGDDYIAIGGSFSRGLFPHDLPPGERVFEEPSSDVMDGALARVKRSPFILDLRQAEKDPAARAWLA